ncbi:heme-degrading domain-containing protein [Pseudoduganella sp. SL102]|uniref:heme-degrading domain-containing protein n=1 Tax=Pseudoduganella sp. SL102 TaxID=2995154 RepID=UPI00248C3AD0|nr:heme-degrading domain-containing protein [Pseudoduganella sp. SL102]WBS00658.1 heme-degrading domain-containing protein [Pseudoduganella sp. SL102]
MHEDFAGLLQALALQEQQLQFAAFSNADALAVGLRIVERARALGKAVTVDITRSGHQLFHHAMDGTTPDNADWVRRKNNVVQRYGRSSWHVGTRYRSRGKTFEADSGADARDFAAHGGAFPIILRGTGVVGTITVSGLPQEEDHEMVIAVLREYLDTVQ